MPNAYFLTIAVVPTACSWQWRVTVRARALRLVAVNRATYTIALLTHIDRVRKSLPVHKHMVFKAAVWERKTHTHQSNVRFEKGALADLQSVSEFEHLDTFRSTPLVACVCWNS